MAAADPPPEPDTGSIPDSQARLRWLVQGLVGGMIALMLMLLALYAIPPVYPAWRLGATLAGLALAVWIATQLRLEPKAKIPRNWPAGVDHTADARYVMERADRVAPTWLAIVGVTVSAGATALTQLGEAKTFEDFEANLPILGLILVATGLVMNTAGHLITTTRKQGDEALQELLAQPSTGPFHLRVYGPPSEVSPVAMLGSALDTTGGCLLVIGFGLLLLTPFLAVL